MSYFNDNKMQGNRKLFFGSVFLVSMAGLGFNPAVWGADIVVPEAALYVTHSKIFRSRFAAGLNFQTDGGSLASGNFEYDLDVGLKPFFRRYLFKDPNVEKAQRVTTRIGFAHLPDFKNDDRALEENRGILELTVRFPFGGTWLLSDRNKGDFRWVDGVYSTRYRNRLRVEHSLAFQNVKFTPYANGEVYYDFKTDEWSRSDLTLGSEFPLPYKTVLEFYFTHYNQRRGGDGRTIGFVFQKHIVTSTRGGT